MLIYPEYNSNISKWNHRSVRLLTKRDPTIITFYNYTAIIQVELKIYIHAIPCCPPLISPVKLKQLDHMHGVKW